MDGQEQGRDEYVCPTYSGRTCSELTRIVVECPKPKVIEDRDVILKVTGSTVCGSDLHLLHGSVVEMQKGDILGHEFCGLVDEMGSGVKGFKKGDRVVASFQIACGDVSDRMRITQLREAHTLIVHVLQEEAVFSV